jgi:hypothetical protein
VFEIGNSLREARLRQGDELSRVESETKIRGKYLHALEDERFDLIPGETYVKGFLRAYAEYLGLDGQLYVDEFNSRFATADGEEPPMPVVPTARRAPRRSRDSNLVIVALAGIVAVAVLVVVAWQFGSPSTPTPTTPVGLGTGSTSGSAPTKKHARAKAPRLARLVLTAARGPCWVRARVGSAAGRLLYEGTLDTGQVLHFARKRLWLELGNPSALKARLNGHRVRNLPTASSTVVVTAKALRKVSHA